MISLIIGSTLADDSEDGPATLSPSNKFDADDKAARDSEDRRTNLKSASAKLVASSFILGEVAWISAGIGPPRRRNHWIWSAIVFDCGYRVDNWKAKKKRTTEHPPMRTDIVLSNNIWVPDFSL